MASITQAEIKKQIEDHDLKRYVLSVVSGQEAMVIENLIERVKKQWLQDDIVDYYYPVAQEKRVGKTKTSIREKKLYPGYVFVRSKMDDKIWYVIRNTPGVRLIVGADTHPVPVTDQELADIKQQVADQNQRMTRAVPYKIGDVVELKDGSFEGATWPIQEIDEENESVVVSIEMLGRMTPVVISFDKVQLQK